MFSIAPGQPLGTTVKEPHYHPPHEACVTSMPGNHLHVNRCTGWRCTVLASGGIWLGDPLCKGLSRGQQGRGDCTATPCPGEATGSLRVRSGRCLIGLQQDKIRHFLETLSADKNDLVPAQCPGSSKPRVCPHTKVSSRKVRKDGGGYSLKQQHVLNGNQDSG